MFKVWVSVEAAPTHSILDEEKDDIARIISPDLTAHFTVSFDGEEKQLDESVPLNTSRVVPLIFSALPLPPPLPPPPPTLRGKYVEREFVSLNQVIEQMESSPVAFLGPKGSGKSTTLREAYYHAQNSGEKAFCFDLNIMAAKDYSNYDGRGSYFFVDNAQMLRHYNSMNSFLELIVQGKVCLAFSSNVFNGGFSYINCPLKCPQFIDFLPFARSELQMWS